MPSLVTKEIREAQEQLVGIAKQFVQDLGSGNGHGHGHGQEHGQGDVLNSAVSFGDAVQSSDGEYVGTMIKIYSSLMNEIRLNRYLFID